MCICPASLKVVGFVSITGGMTYFSGKIVVFVGNSNKIDVCHFLYTHIYIYIYIYMYICSYGPQT